jgi:cytochrome oxidase assembly protein ShyY1
MTRLLLSPRWLGYLGATVVFSIVSSFFGLWQWDRREQAVAAITVLENNWSLEPRPWEELRGSSRSFDPDQEWTPVMVTGEYQPDDQLLVRTRPRSGAVGFEVLVPMRTSTGEYIVVNRGWIPTGEARDFPDVLPPAPTGGVSIVGRIKPGEPTLPGRGAPEGQLPSIDLGQIADLVDYPIDENFYVLLATETPPVSPAPLPALRPQLDEGPHLSYTFQWFVFALLAFIGFFVLLRQEADREAGIEPKRGPGRSDAEQEDALIDQAGA